MLHFVQMTVNTSLDNMQPLWQSQLTQTQWLSWHKLSLLACHMSIAIILHVVPDGMEEHGMP